MLCNTSYRTYLLIVRITWYIVVVVVVAAAAAAAVLAVAVVFVVFVVIAVVVTNIIIVFDSRVRGRRKTISRYVYHINISGII